MAAENMIFENSMDDRSLFSAESSSSKSLGSTLMNSLNNNQPYQINDYLNNSKKREVSEICSKLDSIDDFKPHSSLNSAVANFQNSSDYSPLAEGKAQKRVNGVSKELAQAKDASTCTGNNSEGPFGAEIVWRNVVIFVFLHAGAVYGLYLLVARAMWLTWLWGFAVHIMAGLGITAGAHRLWAHRAYKASHTLKHLLVIFNSLAFQNDVIEWVRDHRCHHKWSETDADPHDSRRGFFFSHIGWLMLKKHPEVKRKGKMVDISDLTQDPLLLAQRKYYLPSVLLFCFIVPSVVPWLLWGESLWVGFYVAGVLRYACGLHVTWTVNSLAHMYGNKPYDRNINPRESYLTVVATLGEGYHNYHHTFPQDYRASEYPWRINATTMFIDLWAAIGWASDRKVISQDKIEERKLKNA